MPITPCGGESFPDLQTWEERQERVHPAANTHGGIVHVYVEQQRRLADVLHNGTVVLEHTYMIVRTLAGG